MAQAWTGWRQIFQLTSLANFSHDRVRGRSGRRLGAALLAFAVVTLLTACSRTERKRDDQIYKAYGDTWVYSKTEISTRYLALYSPHGLFGMRNGYQEKHLIRDSAGNTISIPDNLYALQRDGTLKKIECCQYFRESGDLYNFDDRLVFIFDNAREFITDCFIYPAGRPDNELQPPGKRIYGVTVFAEFDPEAKFFKISTFSAGDNYLPFEYRAAGLRTGRQHLTIREHYAFLYARRKLFMCEGSVAAHSARSNKPALDNEAYQGGATRTVQISVAATATRSLVDRLQTFASRKGFKTWQAGSADGVDVSLALRGEEILTIATGDDSGLWRVALYRRMAKPPSELPSEESVDALLREIRSELGTLPDVRFVD
jgi:hypothetical protein